MRITVHPADTVDRVDPSANAIHGLGTESRKWSREGNGDWTCPNGGRCSATLRAR
ncbi:hypothetical protein SBC1_71890 (plasmid) [Caballeronia sp. SBC1]|nr:hypothetical protein SBC2_75040 [Caballeronia sp. SBC2]QIN67142.1 hypothetical protein SBC1_71890 [Caballeronia sp. SBC1]